MAENLSFGDHALGGGWQLQLFESGAIRNRLKSVTSPVLVSEAGTIAEEESPGLEPQ